MHRGVLSRLGGNGRNERDQVREQRLETISGLADRFLYDFGRMSAGHEADLDSYLAPDVADAIRDSVAPLMNSGRLVRPDFGPYGEMRVEGDLLDADRPIDAWIEFDDRSRREAEDGHLGPPAGRRVRLWLRISLVRNTITSLRCTFPGDSSSRP